VPARVTLVECTNAAATALALDLTASPTGSQGHRDQVGFIRCDSPDTLREEKLRIIDSQVEDI